MKASMIIVIFLWTASLYGQFKAYNPDGTRIDKNFTTIRSVIDSLELSNVRTRSVGKFIFGFHYFSDSVLFILSNNVVPASEILAAKKSYNHKKYLLSSSYRTDLSIFFDEGPWNTTYIKSVFGEPDTESRVGDEKTMEWSKYGLKTIFANERLNKAIVTDLFSGSASNFLVSDFNYYGDENTIGCRIEFFNNSRKEIKYLHFTVGVMNRVKDRIGTKKLSAVGPVAGFDFGVYENENVMYSKVSEYLVIDQVRVQYMDGSEKTYPKAQIEILKDHVVYQR